MWLQKFHKIVSKKWINFMCPCILLSYIGIATYYVSSRAIAVILIAFIFLHYQFFCHNIITNLHDLSPFTKTFPAYFYSFVTLQCSNVTMHVMKIIALMVIKVT